jgi:hypothetical protein
MKVHCDTLTDFLIERFTFIVFFGDSDIAAKRVGETNTQLFSWHWPGNNELILPIVTSIVDRTILSIVNAAIASVPDPSQKIQEPWGCREEPNVDGGLYTRNITPIIDNNTAARWVQAAIKLNKQTLFLRHYRGQQSYGTAGAQTPMCGGPRYLPLDDILSPPAKDMIDDIREQSDDDSEMQRTTPRYFPKTNTGFQMFEQILQQRIIRQHQYLQVIQNCDFGLFANDEQRVVADEDVAWLREHNHIVNPPAAGSLANRKHTSSRPAGN